MTASTGKGGFVPDVPVVLAASAPWETPTPVNAHHIARRLAARGHRVLFVESTGLRAPALGRGRDVSRIAARLRRFAGGVRREAERLDVLAPLALPGGGPGVFRRASLRALAVQVRRAAADQGARPVLWSFLPTGVALADPLDARLVVYHCVDHYAANPGVDAAWVDGLEARMLERADLVFATSPVLAERLTSRRSDVVLVPNVADVDAFAAPPGPEPAALATLPRPRVLFAGNLAGYRIDFELLLALARARPELALVLVGPEGQGDVAPPGAAARALHGLPNVTWAGPVAWEALPTWFAHADVGLIPFLDNDHTRGSLPLKLFEYLAAGLPVVATDLPNLAGYAEPGVLSVVRGGEAFVDAVDAALAAPAEARARRVARAREHDWRARMDGLCAEVGRALDACARRL